MHILFAKFLVIFISTLNVVYCLEALTATFAGIAIIGSTFLAGINNNCYTNECCTNKWIKFDQMKLADELKRNLFGQHLVDFVLLKSIKAHLEKKEPKKALVMSFHGDTGCGKNHVSKMIAQSLFNKGANSKFFHLYIGTRDFPHKSEVKAYRDKLQKEIEEKTKSCERSLFVFDELDKIPPGVLDVLTPYLDFHESVDGVDFRKNIFIFLSNAGSKNITSVALKFWANGRKRSEISLKDLEKLITTGAYNELGGLKHSDIVKRDLINVYVPFLPLEKEHVKKCVKAELQRLDYEGEVDMIANELSYFPADVELFSVHGCKQVEQKVSLYGNPKKIKFS